MLSSNVEIHDWDWHTSFSLFVDRETEKRGKLTHRWGDNRTLSETAVPLVLHTDFGEREPKSSQASSHRQKQPLFTLLWSAIRQYFWRCRRALWWPDREHWKGQPLKLPKTAITTITSSKKHHAFFVIIGCFICDRQEQRQDQNHTEVQFSQCSC